MTGGIGKAKRQREVVRMVEEMTEDLGTLQAVSERVGLGIAWASGALRRNGQVWGTSYRKLCDAYDQWLEEKMDEIEARENGNGHDEPEESGPESEPEERPVETRTLPKDPFAVVNTGLNALLALVGNAHQERDFLADELRAFPPWATSDVRDFLDLAGGYLMEIRRAGDRLLGKPEKVDTGEPEA